MDTIVALWKLTVTGERRGRLGWWSERAADGWSWYMDGTGALAHAAIPANDRNDEACKENNGVAFGCIPDTSTGPGIWNSRTKTPPSRVNGTYLGNWGSARRSLCEWIIRGIRPASITCFPWEITRLHDRKWWGDDGTCQQSLRRKRIDFVPAKVRTCTSP